MYEDYFIIDIETCPLNLENYFSLEEEEKLKLLNPIDSRIVAIGIRHQNQDKIFMDQDEKKMLQQFWAEWKKIKQETPHAHIIGFNILNFDIPFIVSRSFIHNVEIVPFLLKTLLDLREKINAHRYGKTRGKLSDYGKLLGLRISEIDGSQIAELCKKQDWISLKNYLLSDLTITEEIFKRLKSTNILHINKW